MPAHYSTVTLIILLYQHDAFAGMHWEMYPDIQLGFRVYASMKAAMCCQPSTTAEQASCSGIQGRVQNPKKSTNTQVMLRPKTVKEGWSPKV